MRFMDTYRLLISTVSPVHIGCGHDYEPTNYVIDDDKLYAFEPASLVSKLNQSERDELSRIADKENSALTVQNVQKFFFRHREQAMEVASHSAPVAKAVANFYTKRIGQVANRQSDGQNVINNLEIARTAFDPLTSLPLLPGSSLKGAIRTALLEQFRAQLNKRYPMSDNDARQSGRVAKKMETELMGGSFNTDPLRLIKIGDAMFRQEPYVVRNPAGEELTRVRLAREILFQVNRKKKPNQFEAKGKVETVVECVPALQPLAFACQLVVDNQAKLGDKSPGMQIDSSLIAQACNSFYIERFKKDLAMLDDNKYVSTEWATLVKKRLEPTGIWGKLIACNTGFLLRVGRHSGAESVTVDAPRKIKIMKGQGASPSYQSEATTVWLAASEKAAVKDMLPFGWVFVQIK